MIVAAGPPSNPTWTIVPCGRVGREVAVGFLATDHVEEHVDAVRLAVLGEAGAQGGQPVGRRSFEHEVGAQRSTGVRLAGRARHGDPGADRADDLDRCRADA